VIGISHRRICCFSEGLGSERQQKVLSLEIIEDRRIGGGRKFKIQKCFTRGTIGWIVKDNVYHRDIEGDSILISGANEAPSKVDDRLEEK